MEPHEAGVAKKLHAYLSQRLVEGGVEVLARGEIFVVDDKRGRGAAVRYRGELAWGAR